MKVPRRPYGAKHGTCQANPALPQSVPILGLGCSSFSTFYWTNRETEERKQGGDRADGTEQWSRDGLQRAHPVVQEWIETVVAAVADHGITLLDTAPWYGHGTSEIVVGWAIEELLARHPNIRRSDVTVNTKVCRYEADPKLQFDFSYDKTVESARTSLQRLKVDYVDVLQLHDPEFAPSLDQLFEETIPAMLYCKKQGWCKALGITGYPLEVQHQILAKTLEYDWSKVDGEIDPTTVWDQALTYGHFNLHDRSVFSSTFIDAAAVAGTEATTAKLSFFDFCQGRGGQPGSDGSDTQNGIRIMAAAPLSMGLLTPDGPPQWHPADSELKAACRRAVAYCKECGVDIASLAILFAVSQPSIPCTLLGIKNHDQLRVAVDLVNRLRTVDNRPVEQEEALALALNENEFDVWKHLNDRANGPFAPLWRQDSTAYKWDGVKDAHKFWEQVEDVDIDMWQNTPHA